jgi:hypothetical protein
VVAQICRPELLQYKSKSRKPLSGVSSLLSKVTSMDPKQLQLRLRISRCASFEVQNVTYLQPKLSREHILIES